jgi:hypothetical protein
MVGGDLHWIWQPYSIYQEVDWVRRFFSDQLSAPTGMRGKDIRRQGPARTQWIYQRSVQVPTSS